MQSSVTLLSLGLALIACGGTATQGDNSSGGGGADSDADGDGGSAVLDEGGAAPVGEPGCFDATPGDGVGSSNCSPDHDFLDEPASCVAASCINVSPTHLSPTDGCEWQLTCDGNIQLTVECDGENDGTNTSLCTCHIDGDTTKDAGLVQGEGVEACLNAYINCLDPACAQ